MSYEDKQSEPKTILNLKKTQLKILRNGKRKGQNYQEKTNFEKSEVISVLGIVLESDEVVFGCVGVWAVVDLLLKVAGGPVGLLKGSWLLKGLVERQIHWVLRWLVFCIWIFYLTRVLHLNKNERKLEDFQWDGSYAPTIKSEF